MAQIRALASQRRPSTEVAVKAWSQILKLHQLSLLCCSECTCDDTHQVQISLLSYQDDIKKNLLKIRCILDIFSSSFL